MPDRQHVSPVKGADLLLVISNLGLGGSQRVLTTLANAWVQKGKRVSLLVLSKMELETTGLDPSVDRIDLFDRAPSRTFLHLAGAYRLLRLLPKIRRSIKRSGAPVVISFIRSTNVKVVLACMGLKGVRVVISDRSDPTRQKVGRLWEVSSRLCYRFADAVTANSRGTLKVLGGFVPPEKLSFVPNPLPPAPSHHQAPKVAPTLLAVGRLVPLKGYDILLSAFARTAEQIPDWRLAILGSGPQRSDLEALAKHLSIAERVDWHGHMNDPFPYYRAADIFVMTSRFEGMPNALLEAMHCGLAAIVTDASPGPLEVVEHERTGLVVPTDDDAALASAILRLAADPGLRRRLGDAAREAMAEYSLERALDVWNGVAALKAAS